MTSDSNPPPPHLSNFCLFVIVLITVVFRWGRIDEECGVGVGGAASACGTETRVGENGIGPSYNPGICQYLFSRTHYPQCTAPWHYRSLCGQGCTCVRVSRAGYSCMHACGCANVQYVCNEVVQHTEPRHTLYRHAAVVVQTNEARCSFTHSFICNSIAVKPFLFRVGGTVNVWSVTQPDLSKTYTPQYFTCCFSVLVFALRLGKKPSVLALKSLLVFFWEQLDNVWSLADLAETCTVNTDFFFFSPPLHKDRHYTVNYLFNDISKWHLIPVYNWHTELLSNEVFISISDYERDFL